MKHPFEPHRLYTLREIEAELGDTVRISTFLSRLGLRERVFKKAVWGFEIIRAARNAPGFSEPDSEMDSAVADAARAAMFARNGNGSEAELTMDDVRAN